MKDAVKNLAARIEQTMDRIQTEEATKTAYIMPFIQLLGYDVFNPLEVVPEFIADIGIKKGEKVDYAIFLDNDPVILIECKDCHNPLCIDNESQLFRYFHATKAKFGILTNGITYKFFTDLDEINKMDTKPFLEINLLQYDRINYNELAKFSKANFNSENIRKTADMLKCAHAIRTVLLSELAAPSEDFVKMIFKKMDCGGGFFTEKIKDKLTPLVKSAIETIINDKVKANLDTALKSTQKTQEEISEQQQTDASEEDHDGVVTTQEEIDACNIVRAIAAEIIDPHRVAMRDVKSYCSILFDDNNRRPICRLYFNNADRKMISIFDTPQEEKTTLADLPELFKMKERIHNAIRRYLADPEAGSSPAQAE